MTVSFLKQGRAIALPFLLAQLWFVVQVPLAALTFLCMSGRFGTLLSRHDVCFS